MVHILGISAFDHDSAACLPPDGVIAAAAPLLYGRNAPTTADVRTHAD